MRLRSSGPVAAEQQSLGIVHNLKRKRANRKPYTPSQSLISDVGSSDTDFKSLISDVRSSDTDFKSLISDVRSSDTESQLKAAKGLLNFLIYHRQHFEKIEKENLVPRFEEFLHGNCLALRVEAALFLLRLFRITVLNSDEWYVKKRMEILLQLLDFPNDDVRQQAVYLLGVIASSSTGRDLVHEYDCVSKFIAMLDDDSLLSDPSKLPLLREVTSTLFMFCKGRSQANDTVDVMFEEIDNPHVKGHCYQLVGVAILRHVEKVKPAYGAIHRILLDSTDDKVLANVCSILSCFYDDTIIGYNPVDIESKTCRRLVQLLNGEPGSAVASALRIIGIITRNHKHSERIVDFGAVPYLGSLLERSIEEEEVCRILTNITTDWEHRKAQVQAVIDAKLIAHLLKLVETKKDERIITLAAFAISNVITGGTEEEIELCIKRLCKWLVLGNNPDLVTACLDGLERIMLKDKESKPEENVYAKQIKEVGGVEKIKKFLAGHPKRVFLMLEKYWPSSLWHTP